jgi:hypothetical protein
VPASRLHLDSGTPRGAQQDRPLTASPTSRSNRLSDAPSALGPHDHREARFGVLPPLHLLEVVVILGPRLPAIGSTDVPRRTSVHRSRSRSAAQSRPCSWKPRRPTQRPRHLTATGAQVLCRRHASSKDSYRVKLRQTRFTVFLGVTRTIPPLRRDTQKWYSKWYSSCVEYHRHPRRVPAPASDTICVRRARTLGPHLLWGMTYRMTTQLLRRLGGLGSRRSASCPCADRVSRRPTTRRSSPMR